MKNNIFTKLILIVLCIISFYSTQAQTKYSSGFEIGYKEGYCYNQSYGCIPPIAPIAPTPNLGESASDFWAGYNRGFIQGFSKSNSTTSTGPYGNKAYIPETKKFTPDYSFYYSCVSDANVKAKNSSYSSAAYDAFVEEWTSSDQISIRYAYINFVYQSWQNNYGNAPKTLSDGFYKVMVANYDNPDNIGGKYKGFSIGTVAIEDNIIVYYREEYNTIENYDVSQENIWHVAKYPPYTYRSNYENIYTVITESWDYKEGYAFIDFGYVNNDGKYIFSVETQIVFFLDYLV